MPGTGSSAQLDWFSAAEMAIWKPAEQLSVSEWAERYRVLSEPAEEKGPLRMRRTPYLGPIMDRVLDPETETIVLCKSAQIAGTEGMLSVMGYFAHQAPCSIMLVLADEDTAKYMSRERIQKMFRAAPELSKLIVEDTFNIDEISLLNGAYIALGWASSVQKLASRPIKILICDEIDKKGYYIASNESSPISLAVQRTETFYSRKILLLSSPTLETGNIYKQLQSCDIIYDWHVPCPACGIHQPLRWSREFCYGFEGGLFRGENGFMYTLGQVVWEGGRKATAEQIAAAGYECGECGAVWSTQEKNLAVEHGRMVPRIEPTGGEKKVGYHINRLYSLLGRSGDIPKLVSDWIGSVDDPKERQGFINSALAEPWRQIVVQSSESGILAAKCDLPAQHVPAGAIALTAFVDCQKSMFWFAVRAWARDFSSWLVHYGTLGTWEEVENLLFSSCYPVVGADSLSMGIWRAAIDTGGGAREDGPSMTEEAYMWVRNNGIGRGCRVWGTRGSSHPLAGKVHIGKPLDKTPAGVVFPPGRQLQIVHLDTSKLKDAFTYRLDLARQNMPMGAYLHADTDHVYVSHIKAEEKRLDRRGLLEWVQVSKRNDLLDCECGNLALADPEWPGGGVNTLAAPAMLVSEAVCHVHQDSRHSNANPYLKGRASLFGR